MARFTRRQLLGAGLGTAAMGLLSGCATPGIRSVNSAPVIAPAASGEKITLTYWSWLKDAQNVADIWNASHPHVQVETVWIPGGNQAATKSSIQPWPPVADLTSAKWRCGPFPNSCW